MTKKTLSDFFPDDKLEWIKNAVFLSELGTTGEIRVVLRTGFEEHTAGNLDEQAKSDFLSYGLGKTSGRTGVLVLLVLDERKFKVLVDSGICEKIPQKFWDDLTAKMSAFFREENFVHGVLFALREISYHLAFHFPKTPGDVNELPNEPVLVEAV